MSVSALAPLVTVWAYEVSNLIVLVAQGATATLSLAGWIPLGVAAVSQVGLSPLTKLIQIVLATGMLLPIWAVLSRARLFVAKTFILAGVAIYLASAYWETLSLLTMIPMALHESLFIAGTGAIMASLLVMCSDRRSPQRRQYFLSNLRSWL
jgi:hypothetical protein